MSRVFQVYQDRQRCYIPERVKPMHTSIRLPYAPQFWVELLESFTNWLARLLRMTTDKEWEQTTVHTITVNPAAYEKTVWEHSRRFMEQYGHPPKTVLLGRNEFRGFTEELYRQISFTATLRYGDHRGIRYMNMEVILVPWMEGVLVLPDLNEK